MSPLASLPWFEATAESPEIPAGVAGVVLALPAELALADGAPPALPLSGTFQITEAGASQLRREDPFAALTILIVESGSARSVAYRPARSAVGPETQSAPPSMRRGWFHTDLFRESGLVPRAGHYFVSAYLGALQSRVHEVRLIARS